MTQDPIEILEYNAQRALDFEDELNVVTLSLARECVRRAREESEDELAQVKEQRDSLEQITIPHLRDRITVLESEVAK